MYWVLHPRSTWSNRRRRQSITSVVPMAAGVVVTECRLGSMPTELHQPRDVRSDLAVLYLHGGAYVLGSGRAYRHLVSRLPRPLAHPFGCQTIDWLRSTPFRQPSMTRSPHTRRWLPLSQIGLQSWAIRLGAAWRWPWPNGGAAWASGPAVLGTICPWVDLTVDAARHRQGGKRDAMSPGGSWKTEHRPMRRTDQEMTRRSHRYRAISQHYHRLSSTFARTI